MNNRLHVLPADPSFYVPLESSGRFMPVEGTVVKNNKYWRDKIKDGSVILKKDPAVSLRKVKKIINPPVELENSND